MSAQTQEQSRTSLGGGEPDGIVVGGRIVPAAAGGVFDSVNPATGQVLYSIAEGRREDIDSAVAAARAAFEGAWGRATPYERQRTLLRVAELLEERTEEFADLESRDMGAPLWRTRGSIGRCVQLLHWYASNAVTLTGDQLPNSAPGNYLSYTVREPVGVVGAITPWNAPTATAVWKIGPALATGCTIVLKPAEQAPLAPVRFAQLCLEAGVPDGVVNVVPGFGHTAGAALAEHPGVDKVTFTGSRETGRRIVEASAGNLKRVTLELGGKSPNIVFADADLEKAVPGAAMAVFTNSGQICSAGTRLFVEAPIYDEFVERLGEFAATLRVGDGRDDSTQLGPLVSQQQLDRVLGYLAVASEEGARTVVGGARLDDAAHAGGYFVPPTVYADVQDGMRIAQEEIFGPVISALSFDTDEEAAARANDTRFGLGSGVWTRDVGRAHRFASLIQAGSVWVNCYQLMDPAVPFGGWKESGYGRESGSEQFADFLNTKAVWINTD